MALIELEGVSKTYTVHKRAPGLRGALKGALSRETKKVRAMREVSFSVNAGEAVGYIGPNGAGKSTTIKVMSGILVPDEGRVSVMGRVPWRERRAHVAEIGVVFGQRSQLWWDTPVEDSFRLLRDIYNVPRADYEKRAGELVEMLDAKALLDVPVRQLSLGQRMKCELIGSLLHAPKLLFLDEPTIGLDAVTKLKLREFLTELNRRGVTMVLTTHDMDDIEALCSRVMVIGQGRLLFDGGMGELRDRYAPHRLLKARLGADLDELTIPGADEVTLEGRDARVRFRPEALPAERAIAELAARAPILDLTVEPPDVERLVADMYERMELE